MPDTRLLQDKHQHPEPLEAHRSNINHARLPIIPDLRFEYSYLRSIQPYIRIDRQITPSETHNKAVSPEVYEEPVYHHSDPYLAVRNHPPEVIRIQWGRVVWVTARDQVISPLLQGALWALASYVLTPLSVQFGTSIGTYARSHLSSPKEGTGVGWLRNLAGSLGFGANGANGQTSRLS